MFFKTRTPLDIKNSQNFITNSSLIRQLIKLSNLNATDSVIEIGAGRGSITKELAKLCKKVIAIELDARLAQSLKAAFKASNVEIIQQNFLTFKLPQAGFKVFSNIPFNITTQILTRLLFESPAEDIYLVLQHEAFLKYAGAPFYAECLKSLLIKPFYECALLHEFKVADFSPAPNVRAVFAHFHKRAGMEQDLNRAKWQDFIAHIFTQSGKTFKQKTRALFSYKQQKLLARQMQTELSALLSSLTYANFQAMFEFFCSSRVSAEKQNKITGAYACMQNAQSKLTKIHRNRNGKAKPSF